MAQYDEGGTFGDYSPQVETERAFAQPTQPAAQTNPFGTGDRQSQVQQILSGLGSNYSPQALAGVESQLGGLGYQLQRNSAGDVRGRIYDTQGNRAIDLMNPDGSWGWVDRGNGSGLGGGGSTSGGGSMSGFGSSFGSDAWGGRANSLYDTLMGRAQQGLDISAKDPIIANQVNSYRAEQGRGTKHYLEQVAEGGGPYKNMAGETRMANERAAQSTGAFQAQLMGRELDARRQEIQQALSLGAGMLTDEQRMGLQSELQQMQNAQAMGRLGLDVEDRSSYWDALRSGLLG